jgi:cobalt-zinc-cadmium resistance protein CzcA
MRLQSLDSLYDDFVKAADLRYRTGETGLLEKTTAETKRGELTQLLRQHEAEFAVTYASLKTFMNIREEFTVSDSDDLQPLAPAATFDTSFITNNPSLKLLYQNALVANQNKKLETAQTLPDFTVGYFNQSIIGFQNVDGSETYFDSGDRFQGFNVGISVPITFFSNASKIKSLSFQHQSLQKEADNAKLVLQTQLENAFRQYQQNLAQYNYYKSLALSNAETIINTAKVSFEQGEISYIEYIQALQTATDVQLNYLQSVNGLNQSVINISYLINQ